MKLVVVLAALALAYLAGAATPLSPRRLAAAEDNAAVGAVPEGSTSSAMERTKDPPPHRCSFSPRAREMSRVCDMLRTCDSSTELAST